MFCFAYPGRCDFEHNLCPEDWTLDPTGDFNWTLIQGSTPSFGTGPSTDHTKKTADGYFLYIESTNKKKDAKARFISFEISKSSRNCAVRFFYHMNGTDIGNLVVYRQTNGENKLLHDIEGSQGPSWQELQIFISDTRDFKVVIEGNVGGEKGDIAIDDISFTPECERAQIDSKPVPIAGPCGLGNYSCINKKCYTWNQKCNFWDDCGDLTDEMNCGSSCDFEKSLCGWYFTSVSKIKWRRQQASQPSLTDRPTEDHTTGANGYYILMVNDQEAQKGDKAHMHSQNFQNSGKNCSILFFYNLWGPLVGTLNVILKTESQIITLWSNSTSQKNTWASGNVFIGAQQEFSIIFEAVRGTSVSGHLAIDDIKYDNCGSQDGSLICGPKQWLCEDRSICIPRSFRCDAKNDCTDGSDERKCPKRLGDCNFDYDDWKKECDWSLKKDGSYIWETASSSKRPETGPDKDHTQQKNGIKNYLFTNSINEGEAEALTPLFPALEIPCRLRFWYYMFGDEDMAFLAVYTLGIQGQKIYVWVANGNKGKQWMYANTLIGNGQNYSVVFRAGRGNSGFTDIAIDDVSFTEDCRLSAGNVTENCDSHHFYCLPLGLCLFNEWRCDKELDCPDDSDELNCVYTDLPTTQGNTTIQGSTGDTTVQEATDLPTPQGVRGSSSTIWITGVVIGSVLFITIIVLAVCFIKKRRFATSKGLGGQHGSLQGIQNPVYDEYLQDFPIGELDTTMFGEEGSGHKNPMSIENPVYEDREFKR